MIELFFELLLQFIAETVLQIVGELIVRFGLEVLAEPLRRREPWHPATAFVAYACFGVAAGAVSLLVFPRAFVRSDALHGISLLITPVLVGGVSSLIGAWRRKHGESALRLDSFGYGFIFAFGMALVRLLFAD